MGDRDKTVAADPILAHNNFLVGSRSGAGLFEASRFFARRSKIRSGPDTERVRAGHAAKLDRFRRTGLWFAEQHSRAFARRLFDAPPKNVVVCEAALLRVGGLAPLRRPLKPFVYEAGETVLYSFDACALRPNGVLVATLGHRPWVQYLLPRVASYAARLGADFVIAGRSWCAEVTTTFHAFDACAKGHKLVALRGALERYSRVLLLDDTVAIRNDAPNVFDSVPTMALGATVEGAEIRPMKEAAASLSLSCVRYGVKAHTPSAGTWFNSGVLVASWPHLSLVDALPRRALDRVLHWDQGFLNALRVKFRVPLVDLGYAFNYVGSFETSNKGTAPFAAGDAFFVHGTTGLLLPPAGRDAWLRNVSDAWAARGL